MSGAVESRLVRVRGRVQGVFFRESCVRAARALGVSGWVRNCADGSVEALVQGTPAQLDEMTAWLRHGPPSARVDEVEATPQPGATVVAGFERRPSE